MTIKNAPLQKQSFEHEPWPVPCIVITANDPKAALELLVKNTEDLRALFEANPNIDDEEPWFGWAFKIGDVIISEWELMQTAAGDPALHSLIAQYVGHVRDYFRATGGEPAFCVHEEKEAGSDAALELMLADPKSHLDLYVSYLQEMDFDHTVALSDHVAVLKEGLEPQQWKFVRKALESISGLKTILEHHG